MRFWQTSLVTRLVISFLLLIIIPLGFAIWIVYNQATATLSAVAFERLETIAEAKADELARWLADQQRDVIFTAWLPVVRQQVQTLNRYPVDDPIHQAIRNEIVDYLKNLAISKANINEIFILSADTGKVLVSTNELRIGENDVLTDYFTQGRRGTFMQKIYVNPDTGHPTMAIATPVVKDNKTLAILVAQLNLNRLHGVFDSPNQDMLNTNIYLVDQASALVLTDADSNSQPPIEIVQSIGIGRALQQQQGQAVYVDYQGRLVIGTYRWLPNQQVALLAEMDEAKAFAPAKELATNIVFVGAGVVIFFLVAIYLLARQVARPILAITETARLATTTGDLNHKAPVMTKDEIGELARTFNLMQDALQKSLKQSEDYTYTLEQRVEERTTALQSANAVLSQRAIQLETSSLVGQQAISILNVTELLEQVVNLLQTNFGYYFVSVWFINETKDLAILQAGKGKGFTLPAQAYTISMLSKESIIVEVCRTGEAYLSNDVTQDPKYYSVQTLPHTQAELVLPLKMGDEVMGVLDFQQDQPNSFTNDDRTVLQILTNQIAIAIRNADLYQQEQQRRQFAESMQETGQVLTSSLDLKAVPQLALNHLFKVVMYQRGLILLQDKDMLKVVAHRGFPSAERASKLHVPLGRHQDDVYLRMAKTHHPIIVDDVTLDPGWTQVDWLPLNHSWLGVPLIVLDKVIGMISLTRPEPAAFSQDDAMFALTFAGQAAVAVENARLYDEIEQRVIERTVELDKANQILEQMDKTKNDFIRVSAHELRTPLTVIQGYAQVLAISPAIKNNENTNALLEGVVSGVKRMGEVVNNMLDVAKIASDTLEMCLEPVELDILLKKIQLRFQSALQTRSLSLTIADLSTLPIIQADSDLLEKVFINLVSNAIKYTPDGGSISITGRCYQANQESMVELVVSDTGIGIDPDHHTLIFETFFQTGPSDLHSSGQTKFKGGGPGLGLAIVRGIVMTHGGQIWVESEGHDEQTYPGSQFYVQLPVGNSSGN